MKAMPGMFFMLIGTVWCIPAPCLVAAGPDARYDLIKHDLYCSIHPVKRDWSLLNGIVAYQSGFLSNFFKAHEKIEALAQEANVPIEVVCQSLANSCFSNPMNYDPRLHVAIDLDDPYQFFPHHFDLLKHLFFVKESEHILKIAQGTKTFAHQIAQNKIDTHNFIEIMAQIVAYGMAYTNNVTQQEPVVHAMRSVDAELRCIRQSSTDQLELLRQHALAIKLLDEEKTRELDRIKKEFDALIAQGSAQERCAIIAQKKQRQQVIVSYIAQKRNELACSAQVHDALSLVRDVQKKLQRTVDENMQAQNMAGYVIREHDKKGIDQAIQEIHLLNINEERARIIEALRIVVRGNLHAARTDIVSRFDKKSGEHVRNFMTVLESALGQELYEMPGLAAKMIMAFVHDQLTNTYDTHDTCDRSDACDRYETCDKSDLCKKLYSAIAKKDALFIKRENSERKAGDAALCGFAPSDATASDAAPADCALFALCDAPPTDAVPSIAVPSDAVPSDAALIDSIECATKAGLRNLDRSYQSLTSQLIAYSKRSELVHPYGTYNKSNFTIVANKDSETKSDKKEDGARTHHIVRFADCVETTLRNIISELISNGDSFDCAALDLLGATPAVQQYFRNFNSTYHDCQTFRARNEWINVVAGHKGVVYKQPEYACAVKATVKNFLHMFRCLFEPGSLVQKSPSVLTLTDVASLLTTLCNQMNDYFQPAKKIELIKITAQLNGEPIAFDTPIGDSNDEHLTLEFMVSKNSITQNIVVTVMHGHANFDVHKITGTVQSAAQNAIEQLQQFLYTDPAGNYQLRNELLDLMTELGFNRAIKQVQESFMMKWETCTPYNYEEQALSQARFLLYFMSDRLMVQRVLQYLAGL